MMRCTSPIALLVLVVTSGITVSSQPQAPICAIDMGSNTFRRIVGSFADGHYQQRSIEKRTLGVGDDLTSHGRISDPKLAEIDKTLMEFAASCGKEGATPVVAVGTSAFRDAPNGRRVVEIAATRGVTMEIATEARESELAYLVGSLGRDDYAVIDNGSRSIELVARDAGTLRHVVFDLLGYRLAYQTFFAAAEDPAAASLAFRDQLRQEAARASFMRGKVSLVGVEFGDMAEVLFAPAELEGRVFTLVALERRLKEITSGGRDDYAALKKVKDIDRALPRLVVAVTLAQEFGYSRLALTERELGTGLIIEAGMKTRRLDMVPHATAPGRSRDAVFPPYRPDPRLYSIRDRHVSFARSKPFTVTRPARAPLGWKAPGGDPKAVRRPSGRKVVASFPAHR